MPTPVENSTDVKEEKKLKACCACPETKRARDEWYENCFSNKLSDIVTYIICHL